MTDRPEMTDNDGSSDQMRRVEQLIANYLEGCATEQQLDEFFDLLSSDEDARRAYSNQAALDGVLTWMHQSRRPPVADAPTVQTEPVSLPERRSTTGKDRHWRTVAAAAAMMAAVALVAALWNFGRSAPQQQTVVASEPIQPAALLVGAVECQWEDEQEVLAIGHELRGGDRLAIRSGFAELKFQTGATVLLEGPARLAIESADLAILESGRLTADVPEEAIGFEVRTEQARVIDYGTTFGVSVDEEQATELVVFDGLIEAELTENDDIANGFSPDDPEPGRDGGDDSNLGGRVVLTPGIAARTSAAGDHLETTTAELDTWTRELPAPSLSAVTNYSGDLRIVKTPPKVIEVNRWEDPNFVQILAENQDVELIRNLHIGFSGPGEFKKFTRGLIIPKGTRLDSFLVNFDPPKGPPIKRRCSIRFAQPILGIESGTKGLAWKDKFFALPNVKYPRKQKGEMLDFGQDSLVISEDRRTVTFTLKSDGENDQFRILVASE